MAGSIQNTVILFKPETTSGTDSAPGNTTDAVAIRISNLSVKIDEKFAERDVIVGGFAAPDKLAYTRRGMLTFSVELQGSGTLGTAPQWGDLLKCCAFAETISAGARVEYTPVSTALTTGTIWAYINNRLEKFNYASGTVKMSMAVGKVPSLDFTFTSLVSSSAASAPAAPTLSAWIRAQAVGPTFTTQLSMGAVTYSAGALSGGTAYNFQSFDLDMANDVQDIALATQETISIYGRNPSVALVADLGGTAHAAMKAAMHAGTQQGLGFVHGTVSGAKVGIYAPLATITSVEDQINGAVMLDKMGFTLRPQTLNDELRIFCI